MYLTILPLLLLPILTSSYATPRVTASVPSSVKTIAQFEAGSWAENIAARSNGEILTTLRLPGPFLYSVNPDAPSESPILISNLTTSGDNGETSLHGITETAKDQFYVIAANDPLVTFAIFHVDLTAPSFPITAKKVTDLPGALFPNGLATLSAAENLIIAADSTIGQILLINTATGANSVLLKDPTMAPTTSGTPALGINGVHVLETETKNLVWLYYSNTGQTLICRVLFNREQLTQVGDVEVLLNGTRVDDFAIDVNRKVLWLASNAIDGIVTTPLTGGATTVVFNGTADLGIEVGQPTSCTIGRGRNAGGAFCSTQGGSIFQAN